MPFKSNPNTVEFYDRLYEGWYEIAGVSKPFTYDSGGRMLFYQKLVKQPFFNFSGKLLDVGCGKGTILSLLKTDVIERFGIDWSKVGIKKCIQKVKGHFCVGNIHKLPYKNNFFDRVMCTQTLEHVDDVVQVIREMCRVLKIGGKILITVPEQSQDIQSKDWPGGMSLHINKFSIDGTKELIKKFACTLEFIDVVGKIIHVVAFKHEN